MKTVYLTLLCLTRNSEKYIQEHATFYALLGFDRLIYVLHKCEDKTEEKLFELKKKLGLDMLIHKCNTDGHVQMGIYNQMIEKYKNTTEWILPIDDDEYVYMTNPTVNYQNDVKELLQAMPKRVSAVSIASKVFGPNRHIVPPDYRLTSFMTRLPLNTLDSHAIKTFIKTEKFIKVLSPHYQKINGKTVDCNGNYIGIIEGWRVNNPVHYPICYNHYHTGSLVNWLSRYQRGSCNDLRSNEAYSIDSLMYHTQNMEYDNTITKYVPYHKILLDKLNDQ